MQKAAFGDILTAETSAGLKLGEEGLSSMVVGCSRRGIYIHPF